MHMFNTLPCRRTNHLQAIVSKEDKPSLEQAYILQVHCRYAATFLHLHLTQSAQLQVLQVLPSKHN